MSVVGPNIKNDFMLSNTRWRAKEHPSYILRLVSLAIQFCNVESSTQWGGAGVEQANNDTVYTTPAGHVSYNGSTKFF